MAENDMDSGQPTGTTQNTNSGSSAGNGDQQSSIDAAKLQSTLEALTRKLDEVDARSKALQGDKDRGIKEAKKDVGELKRKIAEIERLKGSGLGLDDAIEEVTFRDDIRSLKEQLSNINKVPAQSAGNGAGEVVDTAKLVAEYGLSDNDPDVIEAKRQNSGEKLELALTKLAYRRAKQPQPSPASAPAAQGGDAGKPAGVEQLTKKYAEDMIAARGNVSLLKSIKEQARKDGVPVDSIGFR